MRIGAGRNGKSITWFYHHLRCTITATPYIEGGFQFDLVFGDHFGDASVGGAGTLNWHNGGSNDTDLVVIMTQVGGGQFSVTSFELAGLGGLAANLTVDGTSYTTTGVHVINTGPISSLVFDLNPIGNISEELSVAIDNVNVDENINAIGGTIPEPTSLAIWSLLGGIGFIWRRRSRRSAA